MDGCRIWRLALGNGSEGSSDHGLDNDAGLPECSLTSVQACPVAERVVRTLGQPNAGVVEQHTIGQRKLLNARQRCLLHRRGDLPRFLTESDSPADHLSGNGCQLFSQFAISRHGKKHLEDAMAQRVNHVACQLLRAHLPSNDWRIEKNQKKVRIEDIGIEHSQLIDPSAVQDSCVCVGQNARRAHEIGTVPYDEHVISADILLLPMPLIDVLAYTLFRIDL